IEVGAKAGICALARRTQPLAQGPTDATEDRGSIRGHLAELEGRGEAWPVAVLLVFELQPPAVTEEREIARLAVEPRQQIDGMRQALAVLDLGQQPENAVPEPSGSRRSSRVLAEQRDGRVATERDCNDDSGGRCRRRDSALAGDDCQRGGR